MWTGIFSSEESTFSARKESQIFYVVFKNRISDPGGGSSHTLLNGEYP